jgi:hypothetical protein
MNIARAAALLLLLSPAAQAANPRYLAASGNPRVWTAGTILYATDPGDLSATVNHAAADALVAAAAGIWSAVPTANIALSQNGTLAEDVNSSNVYLTDDGVVFPPDVTAGGSGPPIAILYDYDGAITDTLLGSGASAPSGCRQNAVTESVDGFWYARLITHAIIILNGRCIADGTVAELSQMQYDLLRVFGRVLGLGWSQLNDNVFTGTPAPTLAQEQAWPIMHPIDIDCGPYAYQCIVNPFTLRLDDVSSLSYLYPIYDSQTPPPGKSRTYARAARFYGTVSFPGGQGMQGVNLEAHILFPGTGIINPAASISAVSGFRFTGDAANPITGSLTAAGLPLSQWGDTVATDEGAYQINELDVPTGLNWLSVSVVPVAINPLYIGTYAVGPYSGRQVQPSGTLASILIGGANADSGSLGDMPMPTAARAAAELDGTELSPLPVNPTGWWSSSLATYGHTAWYSFSPQAGRTFTLTVTALDESGSPTTQKLLPILGVWNATDATGSTPFAATSQAFNTVAPGATSLTVATAATSPLRLAIADECGDGRPDFTYTARLLYADSVTPAALPVVGGPLTITGLGFRPSVRVTVGGVAASVTAVTANALTVAAPALAALSGVNPGDSVDLTVTDLLTGATATITAALAYAPAPPPVTPPLQIISGDAQSLVAAATFAPVVLQATDGLGNGLPNLAVTIYQTVTIWAPPCPPTGRCPQPAILATSITTQVTDSTGEVTVTPLQIPGSEQTRLLAASPNNGLVQSVLEKH